jgi:hypothetical protein
VSHEDAKSCIRLLGQEVLPAVREMGKELGLWSPFEANAPVSIAYAEGPALDPLAPGGGEGRSSSRNVRLER